MVGKQKLTTALLTQHPHAGFMGTPYLFLSNKTGKVSPDYMLLQDLLRRTENYAENYLKVRDRQATLLIFVEY